MEIWMYATRLPAMMKYRIIFNPRTEMPADMMKKIPAETRWKADNYNHLHEQPTIFYAVIAVLSILASHVSAEQLGNSYFSISSLAWLYVALRIVHSLVQSLVNNIPARFLIFVASSFVLLLLSLQTASLLHSLA
jgi:hypothetical protein